MGVLPTFAGVFSKQWWDAKEKASLHSIHIRKVSSIKKLLFCFGKFNFFLALLDRNRVYGECCLFKPVQQRRHQVRIMCKIFSLVLSKKPVTREN